MWSLVLLLRHESNHFFSFILLLLLLPRISLRFYFVVWNWIWIWNPVKGGCRGGGEGRKWQEFWRLWRRKEKDEKKREGEVCFLHLPLYYVISNPGRWLMPCRFWSNRHLLNRTFGPIISHVAVSLLYESISLHGVTIFLFLHFFFFFLYLFPFAKYNGCYFFSLFPKFDFIFWTTTFLSFLCLF